MKLLLSIAVLPLAVLAACDSKPAGTTPGAASGADTTVTSSAPPGARSQAAHVPSKPPAPSSHAPIPGPPLVAENAVDVHRFPNETLLGAIGDHIQQDMFVRTAPNKDVGAVIAPLRAGTPVTKLARRGQWILVTFADPKDKAKTLAGWTWEQAFFHPAGPGDEKRLCECWMKQHDADATCEAVAGKSKAECDRTFGKDCEKLVECVHGEIHATCLDGERLLLPQGVCAKVCKSNAACPNDQMCTDKLGAPSVCVPAQMRDEGTH